MPAMRGDDRQPRARFSYVVRRAACAPGSPAAGDSRFVDEILREMTREFDALYAQHGRPPPN